MHTVKVIAISFAVLSVCVLAGKLLHGSRGVAQGALAFLPLGLIGAGINMYFGVKRAGYSPAQELPFFLVVFLVPAIPALLIWQNLSE